MIIRFLIFFIVLTGCHFSLASACECEVEPEPEEAFQQADLIFQGKVVFVNTNWISGGWKFSFEVEKTWKRSAARFLIINTGWERDCGYVFKEGKTYLVYADKTFGLKTSKCMGNKPIEEADRDLFILGEGIPPEMAEGASTMGITLIILGLLSLGFMAFVVLRKRKP